MRILATPPDTPCARASACSAGSDQCMSCWRSGAHAVALTCTSIALTSELLPERELPLARPDTRVAVNVAIRVTLLRAVLMAARARTHPCFL